MNQNKINQAIKELELSLQTEMKMLNPNKIKSLTLMDTLSCLVSVVKEQSAEINKRDLRIEELAGKIKDLETKYAELIEVKN